MKHSNIVVDRAIKFYESAMPNLISFYDRGIYFLEYTAKKYNGKMSDKYYNFVQKHKYDEPVFIFLSFPEYQVIPGWR